MTTLTQEQLDNASTDASTFEHYINDPRDTANPGHAAGTVTARLGNTYDNLAKTVYHFTDEGVLGEVQTLHDETVTAAASAVAAASFNLSFVSMAAATAATIDSSVISIRLTGYYANGDMSPATYKKSLVGEPRHAAKIHSADGAWWEYVPGHDGWDARAFGIKADGTNEDAKIRDIVDLFSNIRYGGSTVYAGVLSGVVLWPNAPVHHSKPIIFASQLGANGSAIVWKGTAIGRSLSSGSGFYYTGTGDVAQIFLYGLCGSSLIGMNLGGPIGRKLDKTIWILSDNTMGIYTATQPPPTSSYLTAAVAAGTRTLTVGTNINTLHEYGAAGNNRLENGAIVGVGQGTPNFELVKITTANDPPIGSFTDNVTATFVNSHNQYEFFGGSNASTRVRLQDLNVAMADGAFVTGRIDNGTPGTAGNVFTVDSVSVDGTDWSSYGVVQVGSYIGGEGILPGTIITAFLTGSGGVGTYTCGTINGGTRALEGPQMIASQACMCAKSVGIATGNRIQATVQVSEVQIDNVWMVANWAYAGWQNQYGGNTKNFTMRNIAIGGVLYGLDYAEGSSVLNVDGITVNLSRVDGAHNLGFAHYRASAGNVRIFGHESEGMGRLLVGSASSSAFSAWIQGSFQTNCPTDSRFTGSISGTTLTVDYSTITGGRVPLQHDFISGTGVAARTQITGFPVLSAGTTYTYAINVSQTVASEAMTAATDIGCDFPGTLTITNSQLINRRDDTGRSTFIIKTGDIAPSYYATTNAAYINLQNCNFSNAWFLDEILTDTNQFNYSQYHISKRPLVTMLGCYGAKGRLPDLHGALAITSGSMTNNGQTSGVVTRILGELASRSNAFNIDYTAVSTASQNKDFKLGEIPPRSRLVGVYIDTDTAVTGQAAFAGTTGACTLSIGITDSSGSHPTKLLVACDIKTAAGTFGLLDAHLGTYLNNAAQGASTGINQGAYLPSFTAYTPIYANFYSATGNLSNLTAGNVTIYVVTEYMHPGYP
ncbi:MAG: hypothetical protein Q7N50_10830 [Armatimonadota bacterium]|nr:hypothetical protein [Armatimonadota bacterium]